MTIAHHPDPSTLMSYVAGSLMEPLAAVIAAHVALCPHCRRGVRTMERVGAALLAKMPESKVSRPLGENPFPTSSPLASAGDAEAPGDVPGPLRGLVGSSLDQIAWRRLGLGVWHYPLPISKGVEGDLRLLKIGAGLAMPEHGHGGAELTLILRGAYSDELGTFQTGDIADLDEDVEHRPVTDPFKGCICLVASEAKAKFKTTFGRLIQPLTGM